MFNLFKKKSENVCEDKFSDLNMKIGELRGSLRDFESKLSFANRSLLNKEKEVKFLEEKVEDLEKENESLKSASKKTTYSNARNALSKGNLKKLRKALEAVPANAAGFGATFLIYNKKEKELENVTVSSKEEALEWVKQAEKGNVEIVF